MKAAILTISTSVSAGLSEDTSGRALAELAGAAGADVVANEVLADDRAAIEQALRRHCAPQAGISLVFTTGGTGLTHDDVTPEATLEVIDRETPGFAEALRAESLRHTPMGLLTRGVAGVRHRTLIINLPGSPRGAAESLEAIVAALPHALETLAGPFDHTQAARR